MDGFEFAETVRRQDKNIPILFMTARDDFASKERGYHLGIDDYLVKPINLNELVLHVEALLRRANIAAERKLVVGSLVLNEDDVSTAVCVLFAEFRKRAVMKPVYQICEAAKKVTQGDFSVRIAPMRTDGKKDEFEVLFEDFNTMAAELASIEILKNDFVTNVSHELKTPLAVIQNYATILQSEQLSETEMREYSAKIGEAVERLSVLVTNILQINRLENQNIQPVLQPFNISEALCRCILNYDNLLDEKNLTLDTELDQNIILTSNEELLDLVWNNLLSNAIKFTPDDGHIGIELRRD